MSKISRTYRLDSNVIDTLENIVKLYNQGHPLFKLKKATATDVISLLILKEYENLEKEGYSL